MTGAALLNSLGPKYAATSALATLGGTYLLVWIPAAIGPPGPAGAIERRRIERSRGWLVAGVVALAFVVGLFGPGIGL
jgi:hypothetical protein